MQYNENLQNRLELNYGRMWGHLAFHKVACYPLETPQRFPNVHLSNGSLYLSCRRWTRRLLYKALSVVTQKMDYFELQLTNDTCSSIGPTHVFG